MYFRNLKPRGHGASGHGIDHFLAPQAKIFSFRTLFLSVLTVKTDDFERQTEFSKLFLISDMYLTRGEPRGDSRNLVAGMKLAIIVQHYLTQT